MKLNGRLRTALLVASIAAITPRYAQAQEGAFSETRGPRFLYTDIPGRTAPVALDISRTPILTHKIALNLDAVSVREAVGAIAQKSGLTLVFAPQMLPADVRVSLRAEEITVAAALTDVLLNSGVDVVFGRSGSAALVKRQAGEAPARLAMISGRIVDSASGDGITSVTVTVQGTRLSTSSDSRGAYVLRGVPAGAQTIGVRRLGYKSQSRKLDVGGNDTLVADFKLTRTPTVLEEVVATASGQQRRLEVGHVINHVNADSIAPTAPITNLTDLLSGRAAGVQVMQTNGLVGSAVGIRIRGQSSLVLNNDPIVIVDGMRQNNSPGGGYEGMNGGYNTPSRLNDLDFSQVEAVDILSGPAASSQYGTDAANGVIVITTKHGRVGKPQWGTSIEHGFSEVPMHFSDMWFSHGHWTPEGTAAKGRTGYVSCPIIRPNRFVDQVNGYCVRDSLTVDNPLNHKETTMYRSGARDHMSVDVSGGNGPVMYYVAGSKNSETGTIQLPRVYEAQARVLGFPHAIMEPNTLEQSSVRSNLSLQMTPKFGLALNGAYMGSNQRTPAAAQGGFSPWRNSGAAILDSAHNYGYSSGIPGENPLNSLGSWYTEGNQRSTAGLRADWQPLSWFTGYATVGLDHSSKRFEFLWDPRAYYVSNYVRDRGWMKITNSTNDILSFDARGSATHQFTPQLRSVTSVGYQFAKTSTQGITAAVQQVSESNISLNGIPNPQVSEEGTAAATLGGYLEEHVNIAERLFLSGALRMDGASGFGNDYHVTAYPKLNVSWLAINTGQHTLRFRSAFGSAGKQPDNGASLQTYYPSVAFAEGSDRTAYRMSTSGNPDLRPERSTEFEAGLDASLFNDRFTIALSHYDKRTMDALTSYSLGLTTGSMYTQQNLGDIKNWGYEGSVQATILRMPEATWDVSVTASHNDNELLRLAENVKASSNPFAYLQEHRPGYSLNAYWAQRVSYSDANGDGILVPSEITIEDTNSYMGSSVPTVETGIASTMSFLRGLLAVNALFDHRTGGLVFNNEIFFQGEATLRAAHDSTAPLWMQARVRACTSTCINSLNFESGWFVRWRELSATLNVPSSWLRRSRAQRLSLTAAVRNLGMWTHYTGLDPESMSPNVSVDNRIASGQNSAPMPRTWMFRLNAGI